MAIGFGGKTIRSGINVTPLVDVVLVLLIIFMVTTTAIAEAGGQNGGIKVQLPKGGQANAVKEVHDLAVAAAARDGDGARFDRFRALFAKETDPAFRRHVERAVEALHADRGRYETTKRFAIPPGEFSVEGGELTPTLKLKRKVVVERYAARTGRDVGAILFHYVFALFKIAVIVQQIYKRFVEGHTHDPRFAALGAWVRVLGRQAARALERGRIHGLGKGS